MPYQRFISFCALAMLAGCASEDGDLADKSVEFVYNRAMDHFESKSYVRAAKVFSDVERLYPYSDWAVRAQLMSAYSYYEAGKFTEALDAFDTFIKLHPGHKDVPYATYMIGMCHFEQIPVIERDQTPSFEAAKYFSEVISRFPNSKYAKDARGKLDFVRDHMAAKEMAIGRFYLQKKSFLAAINRFQHVVKKHETTNHTSEALFRLVEAYLSIGLSNQAKAAAATLGHNYAETYWYKQAYALMQSHDLDVNTERKQQINKSA